jgi:hypothetical protein
MIVLVAAIAVGALASCAPPSPQPRHDPWFDEDSPSTLTGDFDDAEARWRQEIAGERNTDPDALLKDDPPGAPESYGTVAFKDGEPAPPPTFWGKVRSGAETVGKAGFAAMSVIVTVGMMVAPYLLL